MNNLLTLEDLYEMMEPARAFYLPRAQWPLRDQAEFRPAASTLLEEAKPLAARIIDFAVGTIHATIAASIGFGIGYAMFAFVQFAVTP